MCPDLADTANRLIQERGVRVYGFHFVDRASGLWAKKTEALAKIPTHQALLVCIEELPKKECKHEVVYIDQSYKAPDVIRCKLCDVKLKAKWEVAE